MWPQETGPSTWVEAGSTHSHSAAVEVFRLPSEVWTGACKWSLGPAAGWCLCDWWSWAVSPSWAVIKRSWDQGTHNSASGNKSKAWWSDKIGAVHQEENCGVLNSENFGASAAMAMGFSRLNILGSSAEQNSGFCNDQHCRIFGGDVFREGVLAVRAVEVFSGGGSWVVCKEGHWEPWGPTAWLVLCGWPHPSFCWQLLADVSTMSVSLGIVWDELHLGPSTVPWKGEEAGHSPWSPFPPMIALANRGDPSWHCHAGLKHGVMKTKGRCSFYSSCVVILGFLCFTVSLQLLNWTPELSQSYFGAQIAVRLLVFLIGWRLGPPTLPSSWHHSCTPIYLYAFFPSPLKEYLLVTLALNLIPLSSRPMIHLFLFSLPCTFP